MPKILSFTPPWLARPSPGSKIFTSTPGHGSQTSTSLRTSQSGSPNSVKQNESYQGPRRLLAKRGTEIFTVVDNKIRWADLARVKSDWEEHTGAQRANGSPRPAQKHNGDSPPYRVGNSCPNETSDD
jgi:nucleoporin NUP82